MIIFFKGLAQTRQDDDTSITTLGEYDIFARSNLINTFSSKMKGCIFEDIILLIFKQIHLTFV